MNFIHSEDSRSQVGSNPDQFPFSIQERIEDGALRTYPERQVYTENEPKVVRETVTCPPLFKELGVPQSITV